MTCGSGMFPEITVTGRQYPVFSLLAEEASTEGNLHRAEDGSCC